MALLFYAITLFVSAFLLFLVQPIVGQKILPKLGGTPSVWNTCVVFFQMTLLIGYAYTHFTTKLPVKRQILVHCLLLFLPFLILLPAGPFPVEGFKPVTGGNPMIPTFILLATIVGIPFFVVSTTAPLLQKWFGSTGHPAAADPYFLYGASNLGSMLSLLLYPVFFERILGLEGQSWFYTVGYVVLVGMVVGCGAMVFAAPPSVHLPHKKDETPEAPPAPAPEPVAAVAQVTAPAPEASTAISSQPLPPPAPAPKPVATGIKKGGKKGKQQRDLAKVGAAASAAASPAAVAAAPAPASVTTPSIVRTTPAADPDAITWPRRLRWIGLAAVPSSLMLGVTTYMSTDISAIPLFWVLPLSLYLLSFILVFMRSPINWLQDAHEYVLYAQPALLALLAVFMAISGAPGVVYMILIMLLAFTATALACHGEMAKDRPSAKHLTEFYLLMSVGGAVGGLFNGIIAPVIFSWGIVEFGLALCVAGLLRPKMREYGWTEQVINNMGQPADTHRHGGKHPKKVVRSTEAAGPTLLLDFVLPGLVTALFAILLFVVFHPDNRNYTEAMFYAIIVPAICTACFWGRPLRFGLALGALLVLPSIYQNRGDSVEYTTRSYFGLLRVRKSAEYYGDIPIPYINLMHGTTNHGMALQPVPGYDFSRVATTYYHRQGPVGIAMERFNWLQTDTEYDTKKYLQEFPSDLRLLASLTALGSPQFGASVPMDQLVGCWSEPAFCTIGLGTGTMATYVKPYGTLHFYEIDENIRKFSLPDGAPQTYYDKDQSVRPPFFTYLKSAIHRGGNVKVLMGDARLRMAMPWVPEGMESTPPWELSDKHFDKRGGPEYFYHLMVVDAFSSDAIPRHLITKQAMEMYFRHLVLGHWGNWIKVKMMPLKDQNGKEIGQFEADEAGNPVDRRFYYEEKKTGDVVTEKRPWFPGGMLCVHTSNRHLRLVPVVADTAAVAEWDDLYDRNTDGTPKKRTGLVANRGHDVAPGNSREGGGGKKNEDIGHYTSEWVIVARDWKDLKHLKTPAMYTQWYGSYLKGRTPEAYWTPTPGTGTYIWTDDHTDLMAVFRWPWESGH